MSICINNGYNQRQRWGARRLRLALSCRMTLDIQGPKIDRVLNKQVKIFQSNLVAKSTQTQLFDKSCDVLKIIQYWRNVIQSMCLISHWQPQDKIFKYGGMDIDWVIPYFSRLRTLFKEKSMNIQTKLQLGTKTKLVQLDYIYIGSLFT
ncbi:Hypothetical_protein [Hexamita inflata]|uniref:Hypothetical_protein n=1 Tax=Hexamita inflata TaxID=28002 RepID=A0AA86NVK9_9EUKA|nr:Hypothetical protein HINF_LOCUS15042 [Hexamita inflata]